MAKKYTAQCACGAVKFASDGDPTFFGVPGTGFTPLSGRPKEFHYVAESGKGLDRNFCLECGARLLTGNLAGFPATVFGWDAALLVVSGDKVASDGRSGSLLDLSRYRRPLDQNQQRLALKGPTT